MCSNLNVDMSQLPKPLKKGDTIGIVAPASCFNIKKFNEGLNILSSMGFNIHIPDGLFKRSRYLAGSDHHRAELVNSLFKDDRIRGILCARGGFGSMRILSLLDYKMISSHPKLFMGFSDISAILCVLFQLCGMVCFHGPTITSMGELTSQASASLFSVMSSSPPKEIRPKVPFTISKGAAKGVLVGGNLTTLCHMIGTPFDFDYSGRILFIEETKEAPYRIDRMLTQLKMVGKFNNIQGVVLGDFNECGVIDDVYQIVKEVFNQKNIPVLGGFEIGHTPSNMTIPIGMNAMLDTDEPVLTFH